MAIYTGILGTKDSQPGKFWLGSGPVSSNINSQSLTDNITVATSTGHGSLLSRAITTSITVSAAIGHRSLVNKALVDTITVSSHVAGSRTVIESLSDTVTVADAIVELPVVLKTVTDSVTVSDAIALVGNPLIRITQATTEFFFTETPDARLSQAVIEYFYAVGRDVSQQIIDNVTVTSTPRDKSVSIYMTDLADVNEVFFGRNTNVRISVVTSISISVPEIEKNVITVTDYAVVSDSISYKLPIVHITVVDTVSTPLYFPNPVTYSISNPRILVGDVVTVTDTITGNTTLPTFAMSDVIGVVDSIGLSPVLITVNDTVAIGDAIGYGLSLRDIGVTDAVMVNAVASGRNNHIRKSVEDDVTVSHTRAFTIQQTNISISVVDTVVTTSGVYSGTVELTPFDVVSVSDVIVAYAPYAHEFPVDTISVNENIHLSPLRLTVTDSVTVKSTLSHFELVVVDRVAVTDNVRRVHDGLCTDALSFTETVTTKQIHGQHIVDTLPIIETMSRQAVWYRSLEDTLTFASPSFQKILDFAGTAINVPIAVGTLVSNTTTLQSANGVIILPAPLLGDSLDNVLKTSIQRSMNGATIVFKQSSTRQRLKNTFRLDAIKAFELRTFLEANLSELITLTTWNGQIWSVYVTSDPFELQNAGRSANSGIPTGPNEYSTIELQFEGTKNSG